MAQEIERKFLVVSEAWRDRATHSTRLCDGLIAASGGRKVRVRIYDDRATLTVKGARQGLARDEFEYPIPLAEAQEMLARHCEGMVVEKTRYYVPEGGVIFEIDTYHGILEGVVIAEAELTHPDDPVPRPDWLGPEITGQEQYRKINMLKARLKA